MQKSEEFLSAQTPLVVLRNEIKKKSNKKRKQTCATNQLNTSCAKSAKSHFSNRQKEFEFVPPVLDFLKSVLALFQI